MITKTLGRTGLEVTQLGYGSMGLRGPRTWGVRVVGEEDAGRFLNSVLDAGINFIDTATDYFDCLISTPTARGGWGRNQLEIKQSNYGLRNYGLSEERTGRDLGARRSEFYLATKCGCAYRRHADRLAIRHVWT